jgi:hypothetical protein
MTPTILALSIKAPCLSRQLTDQDPPVYALHDP